VSYPKERITMKQTNEKKIEEIVEDIMQGGFDCAMGGTPFKTEEENRKNNEISYDKCVEKYGQKLTNLIQKRVEEAVREFTVYLFELGEGNKTESAEMFIKDRLQTKGKDKE